MKWSISVAGNSKTLEGHVSSFEISLSSEMLDAATVEIEVDDPAERKTIVNACQPGATFSATLGTATTFTADLVGVTWTTGRASRPRVILHALEKLHRLRHRTLHEIATTAPSAIVSKLFTDGGLAAPTVQTLTTPARSTLLLDDAALAWIKKLSSDVGYSIYFDGSAVKFYPRGTANGTLSIDYFENVFEARVNTNLSDVATSVQVYGRDYTKSGDAPQYKSAASDLDSISGGKTAVALRNTNIGALDLSYDYQGRYNTVSEATDRAKGEMKRRALGFLSGSFLCDGQEAKVASTLTVKRAPWPLGGPYRIGGVTWRMVKGTGMRTQIDVFSDSLPSSS
jgi:hypothetical protein